MGYAQTTDRPKWFMFVTICTIVLGAMGVLAGIWAPVNLLISDSMQDLWSTPGAPAEMRELQAEILAASMPEVMAVLGLANLATGAWALYAAIQLLRLTPAARQPFRKALLALGLYEVLALVLTAVVQVRVFGAMNKLTSKLMQGGPAPPPEAERMMEAVMGTAMIVSAIFAVLWGGSKIAFAFLSRSYANKPDVVAYAGD